MTTALDAYTTLEISVNDIVVGADNPRETFTGLTELADSIREHGLQQPIMVRRSADGQKWILVAGERRLRAVKSLGWRTVPAREKSTALSDREAAVATIVENVEREDLSSYELARACQILAVKYQMTGEEVGKVVRRTKFYVNNLLRCLRQLDPSIIADWKGGHAAATTDNLTRLASLKDSAQQFRYWELLSKGGDPFAVVEEADDADDGEQEAGSSSGPQDAPSGPAPVKADTKRTIKLAESLAAYRKSGGEGAELAIECVRYVLGKRKTNPVALPDKSKELEKAADEIPKTGKTLGPALLKSPKKGAVK